MSQSISNQPLRCPCCGESIAKNNGRHFTKMFSELAFLCDYCGAWLSVGGPLWANRASEEALAAHLELEKERDAATRDAAGAVWQS